MNAQLNNETLSESDQALVNRAQERQILRDAGKSDEDINKMSPGERGDRVAVLSQPHPYDLETIAVSAAASIGTFFAGAIAFAGGGNANNAGNQTPTNNPAVAERPVRTRKEEEGDSDVAVDRDGKPPQPKVDTSLPWYDQISDSISDSWDSATSGLRDMFTINIPTQENPNRIGFDLDSLSPTRLSSFLNDLGNGRITAEVFGKKFGLGSFVDKLNPVKLFTGESNKNISGNKDTTGIQERAVKEDHATRVAEPESQSYIDAKKRLLDTWYDVEVDKKNFPKADLVLKDLLDSPNLSDSDKAYLKEAFENLKKENYNKGKALYKRGTTPDGFKVLKPQEPSSSNIRENDATNNDVNDATSESLTNQRENDFDHNFAESNKVYVQRLELAKENPTIQDYKANPNQKGVLKLFEVSKDGIKVSATLETVERIGKQIITDAIYDYDKKINANIKTKALLDRFIEDNGLDSKDLTPDQQLVRLNLEKVYHDLIHKYETGTKNKKTFQTDADKRAYMDDRIAYMRENHDRLTAEIMVNRYKDQIDFEKSSEQFTVLKDGKGVILNQVMYESQNDNVFRKEFQYLGKVKVKKFGIEVEIPGWVKYTSKPSVQCATVSGSTNAGAAGAKPQKDSVQLSDEIYMHATTGKNPILITGEELKNPEILAKIMKDKYGLDRFPVKELDKVPNPKNPGQLMDDPQERHYEAIKAVIREGYPVSVGGNFPALPDGGGHRLNIVGYDSTGWIVYDPYGDANTGASYVNGDSGSGMYAHYDYDKFNIGKRTDYVFKPEKKE